jgi:predicted secreted protein with PEFG-CTERM motif
MILFVLLAMTFTVSDSFAQEAQTINLITNKNSYMPGDVVVLNGTVNGQPGQLVAIQVKDSTGNLILIRTIQTDQNGNFVLQFKIPTTATSGNFNIMASARINGFIVTQTKTMTATVPEFGQIAMPIFAISIISVMLIFAFSKKVQHYHKLNF